MVTRVDFCEGEVYYPDDGDYVPYEEYEELLAERDALKDLLRAVRASVPIYSQHLELKDRIDAALRGEGE